LFAALIVYISGAALEDLRQPSLIAGALCGLGLMATPLLPLLEFGGMGNPNLAAHFILATLCLHKVDDFKTRPWLWLVLSLQLLGLIMSESRAAWLGLFICALTYTPRQWRWYFAALGLIGLAILAWTWRTDLQRFWQYSKQPQSYVTAYREQPRLIVDREPWYKGKRLSLMNRTILYGNAAAGVPDHWLIGHGWGQFRVSYPALNGRFAEDILLDGDYRVHDVHNFPLRVIFELGLIGLLLFCWAGWRWYRQGSNRLRRLLLVQLCLALVSINSLNPAVWSILALATISKHQPKPPDKKAIVCFVIIVTLTLGWVFLNRQSYRVEHAEEVETIPSWYPEARARLLYEQGQYEQAWQAQERALQWDPHGPEQWVNRGHIAWMRYQTLRTNDPEVAAKWKAIAEASYDHIDQAYPDLMYQRPRH
jgi:O-antigen ligase